MTIVVGTLYRPFGAPVAPVWSTEGVFELREWMETHGVSHLRVWKPPIVRFVHIEIGKEKWRTLSRMKDPGFVMGDDFSMLEQIALVEGDDIWLEWIREDRAKAMGRSGRGAVASSPLVAPEVKVDKKGQVAWDF